jgi:hypothetical protein
MTGALAAVAFWPFWAAAGMAVNSAVAIPAATQRFRFVIN